MVEVFLSIPFLKVTWIDPLLSFSYPPSSIHPSLPLLFSPKTMTDNQTTPPPTTHLTTTASGPGASSPSPSSPSVFLQTTDSSDMFRYVSQQAWTGCAVGTGVAGASQLLAYRFLPAYKNYTNVSARAFLLFAGYVLSLSPLVVSLTTIYPIYRFISISLLHPPPPTPHQRAGVGFTLASEWAMTHYFRYMDRPGRCLPVVPSLPLLSPSLSLSLCLFVHIELTGFQKLSELEQSQVMAKARRTQFEFWKDFAWENRFRLIGTRAVVGEGDHRYCSSSILLDT